MVFSGKFQSDVSTVNNDVRHFDSAKFQPEYQEYGMEGGWWNPCGSGAFRLIDCKVTQVGYKNGTTTSDPTKEPVIGMLIGGSNQRVSGKMVDLDPQMQMVSEIWGLNMRLTDGKTPAFFDGQFLPSPFRDILFGRQQGGAGGDQTATAIYQSVLTDLSWVNEDSSPFLKELKAMSDKVGKLSVRMMVYSYNMDHTNPVFTIGRVEGVIGPALENEPDTFVLGRRFAPLNGNNTAKNINFFNAQVDPVNRNVCIDLSNALPLLGGVGDFVDLGKIQLVVLDQDMPEASIGLKQAYRQFTPIGDVIPYQDPGWMKNSGALFDVTDISDDLFAQIQSQPLALLSVDNGEILIRETQDGLLIRADQVVHRLNPTATATVDFYVSRYGKPSAGEAIQVTVPPPLSGQGTGSSGKAINDIPTPVINIPASAISLSPNINTDSNGKASYSIFATAPGNPRGYIDGQIYLLNYRPVNSPNYIQQQFDFIATLVFDAFKVPDNPMWADVKPVMTQYGNLYPVMSKMLVDLGNYASVTKYRALLELAFSRPISDPNYMPVTRDLSDGKRAMILWWLTQKDDQGNYLLAKGDGVDTESVVIEPCQSCVVDTPPPPTATSQESTLETASSVLGAKEHAAQLYKRHVVKQ